MLEQHLLGVASVRRERLRGVGQLRVEFLHVVPLELLRGRIEGGLVDDEDGRVDGVAEAFAALARSDREVLETVHDRDEVFVFGIDGWFGLVSVGLIDELSLSTEKPLDFVPISHFFIY